MDEEHVFEEPVTLEQLTRLRSESIEHRYDLMMGAAAEPADDDSRAFLTTFS